MTRQDVSVLYEVAGRAAAAHVKARGLPAHMRDDLTQEGVLWLLEHPQRLSRVEGEDVRNTSQVVAEIRRHFVTTGVDRPPGAVEDPADGREYTPDMVALIFPAVYDPEYTPFREQDEAAERFSERDPSEANTWLAMVADVSAALDAYGRKSDNVRYVFRHEILGETFEDIGVAEGVSRETARRRHADVLAWMSDWLSGTLGE
jgi:hypothetical protein